MGRKYAIRNQEGIHFVTLTVINWIDLFIRDIYKEEFVESLKYCQKEKGLTFHAWCIMTSHVHLILSADPGKKLSDILRDFKSYTSTRLKTVIFSNIHESRKEWMLWMFRRAGIKNKRNSEFQLWQQHNHPIELDSNNMQETRLNYIHENPVVAGFVDKPEDWLWSSARDYCGLQNGKIDLVFIE